MELQLHQHFDTHMDPSCSLHKSYKSHSLLGWNRKNNGSKSAETRGRRVWTSRVKRGGGAFADTRISTSRHLSGDPAHVTPLARMPNLTNLMGAHVGGSKTFGLVVVA